MKLIVLLCIILTCVILFKRRSSPKIPSVSGGSESGCTSWCMFDNPSDADNTF